MLCELDGPRQDSSVTIQRCRRSMYVSSLSNQRSKVRPFQGSKTVSLPKPNANQMPTKWKGSKGQDGKVLDEKVPLLYFTIFQAIH